MKRNKGFTLIELLIVIAVIGILAVAVLSAINPVEQIRKARDTRRRSNAAELLNAIERYYATYEANPGITPVAADDDCAAAVAATKVSDLDDLSSELKAEYIDRVTTNDGNEVYVGFDPSTALAIVCYQVESAQNIALVGAGTVKGCVVDDTSYRCVPE